VFCAAGLFVDQSHSERSDCERGDFFLGVSDVCYCLLLGVCSC
jgi:hypothetical protein